MSLEKFKQQLQRGGVMSLQSNLVTYLDLMIRCRNLNAKLRPSINKRTGKPLVEATMRSYCASLKSYEACLDVSKNMIRAQVRKKQKARPPKLKLIKGGRDLG